MRFKYLVSFLAISVGLATYAKAASAEVTVKWQAGDNSTNIQKAIDSGDSMVIIPKADQPRLVGQPIYANRPNQKIIFNSLKQVSDLGTNLSNVTLKFTE
jgi:hypothetical protein